MWRQVSRISAVLLLCGLLTACSGVKYLPSSSSGGERSYKQLLERDSSDLTPIKPAYRSYGYLQFTQGTSEAEDDIVLELKREGSRYLADTQISGPDRKNPFRSTHFGFMVDKKAHCVGFALRFKY